jgi:hypothetical protein
MELWVFEIKTPEERLDGFERWRDAHVEDVADGMIHLAREIAWLKIWLAVAAALIAAEAVVIALLWWVR